MDQADSKTSIMCLPGIKRAVLELFLDKNGVDWGTAKDILDKPPFVDMINNPAIELSFLKTDGLDNPIKLIRYNIEDLINPPGTDSSEV